MAISNTYNNLAFNQAKIQEIATRNLADDNATADADAKAQEAHAAALNENLHPLSESQLKNKVIYDYKKGLADLSNFLNKDHDQKSIEKLEIFSKKVADGIGGHYSPRIHQEYMTQVKKNFDLICAITQDEKLPADMRRQTILTLIKGLDVCAEGVAQNIETAARELNALKEGLPHDFVNRLNHLIESESTDFIKNNKLCPHKGNEIHYVAALFNRVASYFGLPIRKDDFIKSNVTISEKQYSFFAKNILQHITTDQVIVDMAKDCLTQVQDHFSSIFLEARSNSFDSEIFGKLFQEYEQNLKPLLEKSYGPIALENIISTYPDDEERYVITKDSTLIARSIARNLRNAGIVDSFKAEYILGEKGSGIKIKQLGENLVYVSETTQSPDEEKSQHIHSTLEQFIWNDSEKGQKLLTQIAQESANNPELKNIQDGHIEKMSVFLVQQMLTAFKSAPDPARGLHDANAVLDHSILATIPEDTKTTILINALEHAQKSGQPSIAKILIENISLEQLGINDNDHGADLFFLIETQPGIAAILIEKQVHPEQFGIKNNDGNTALLHAIQTGKSEIAKMLIEKMDQQQLGISDNDGNSALIHAIDKGLVDIAKMLIAKMSRDQLGITNNNGNTALIQAIGRGHNDIAKILIEKISQEQLGLANNYKFTALTTAIQKRHTDTTKMLIEKMSVQQLKSENLTQLEDLMDETGVLSSFKNKIRPPNKFTSALSSIFSNTFKFFSTIITAPIVLWKNIYAWWSKPPVG